VGDGEQGNRRRQEERLRSRQENQSFRLAQGRTKGRRSLERWTPQVDIVALTIAIEQMTRSRAGVRVCAVAVAGGTDNPYYQTLTGGAMRPQKSL
jgi:hypothetical protein